MISHTLRPRIASGVLRLALPVLGVVCSTLFVGDAWCRPHNASSVASINAGRNPPQVLRRFVEDCVAITPGQGECPAEFRFGPVGPDEFSDVRPRTVVMDHPFRICRYETTQELYEHVMGTNPSRWTGPRNSVEYVTWSDAVTFCQRLTVLLRQHDLIADDERVRLPTETEWEYCCRAGTQNIYSFDVDAADAQTVQEVLNQYAWSHGNAAGNDPPVGALKPNPWGLYDMHGYLWEYVADDWQPRESQASATDVVKLIRGGSWRESAPWHTCAARVPVLIHAASDAIGFRCVVDSVPDAR